MGASETNKAVILLLNTQIHKYTNLRFPSLQMFFFFILSYVYLFGPKSGFVGKYTNTHYKMTRILFVYL